MGAQGETKKTNADFLRYCLKRVWMAEGASEEHGDAVADALLQLAVRDNAIDQDEATELLNWDLSTIAEYLALRLQQYGFLSPQEVTDILETHTSTLCH